MIFVLTKPNPLPPLRSFQIDFITSICFPSILWTVQKPCLLKVQSGAVWLALLPPPKILWSGLGGTNDCWSGWLTWLSSVAFSFNFLIISFIFWFGFWSWFIALIFFLGFLMGGVLFWALELSVGGGFNFRRVLVVVLSTDGVSGAMVLASKGSTVIPLLGNGDFAATISSSHWIF